MKWIKMLSVAAAALIVCSPARSQVPQTQRYEVNLLQAPNQPYENTIQVNGTAEREVVPDEIYVRIVISENDTKGKTSVDRMEQDMIGALQGLGIDVESDLKVGDMSAEIYRRTLGRREARTTATYELKTDGAAMLGEVYQALARVEIYNLSIMRVAHSRINSLYDELRIEAVQNAQRTARAMAGALGQDIGRAVSILDYNPQPMYARSMAVADMAVMGAGEPVSLDFRNIKLNYSVTVKFVLE